MRTVLMSVLNRVPRGGVGRFWVLSLLGALLAPPALSAQQGPQLPEDDHGELPQEIRAKMQRDMSPFTLSGAPERVRQPNPYINEPLRSRSVRAGIGLRQKLNFLQTRARVEQARAERNKVQYQQESARQLILFEVEEAYRNVLIARAALDAQDRALQISKEWLREEEINFDLDLGDTENLVRAVQSNLELEARYFEAIHRFNVAALRLLDATGTLTRRVKTGTLLE